MESSTVPMSPATKMRLRGVEPKRSPFSTRYSKVLEVLHSELWHLGAYEYVMEIDMDERYFRLDGSPRANAVANSSAIAISFKAQQGPMEFLCGTYTAWQDNVWAIAKGLEALRGINRWGITQAAEQYQGFRAIGSGIALGAASMTVEEAAAVLLRAAYGDHYNALYTNAMIHNPERRKTVFQMAALKLHPDTGGDADAFDKLVKARELLEAS